MDEDLEFQEQVCPQGHGQVGGNGSQGVNK